MMYLRPGNLYKEFVIEDNTADIGKTGRATASFSGDGSRTLKGALAEATPKQKVEWQQLQHPISHTIIQDGRPKAKAEDKLILGERIFLIQGIDDPGSIGVCTIYYVEERMDVKRSKSGQPAQKRRIGSPQRKRKRKNLQEISI